MSEPQFIFAANEVGKYASKVRVHSPVGSVYDGSTGVIARKVAGSRTVMVRLDSRYGGLTLPFDLGELKFL